MATNDADLEYGPTPEDAQYEHTDIDPSIASKFAIWLGVAMVVALGIVYGTFWYFEGNAKAASDAAQVFPMAAGQLREPPSPRLQNQPFKDIYSLREAEQQKLTTYAWVDETNGVVRIPIEDALRLMSERHGIAAPAETPNGLNDVVQDSSSGRTTTARSK